MLRRRRSATSITPDALPGVAPGKRRSTPKVALGLAGMGMASVVAHNARRVLALRRDAASLRLDLEHDRTVGEGLGEPSRLFVIGDSASDGYALTDPRDAFPFHVASHLSAATSRRVVVTSLGRDGARILAAADEQAPMIQETADAVVALVGANDVFGRRTAAQVTADTLHLLEVIRSRAPGATIVVSGCPDFGKAGGFPQPLRLLLGWRCRATAGAMAVACEQAEVPFVDLVPGTKPHLFGADGVHPSRAGSLAAAHGVVEALLTSARDRVGATT